MTRDNLLSILSAVGWLALLVIVVALTAIGSAPTTALFFIQAGVVVFVIAMIVGICLDEETNKEDK